MLLQHGADPTLRNTEGKTALDVADPLTKPVLTGTDYKKDELLEAARSGNEEKLLALLTPLNVNCHASDGRKSTPPRIWGDGGTVSSAPGASVHVPVAHCLWAAARAATITGATAR